MISGGYLPWKNKIKLEQVLTLGKALDSGPASLLQAIFAKIQPGKYDFNLCKGIFMTKWPKFARFRRIFFHQVSRFL
jgi:hypothetical protein